MAAKKPSSVSEKQPEQIDDIKELRSKVESHYAILALKKQASCKDFKSISDFENMYKDAESHKVALEKWHKYLDNE